jgi:ketosteroid isomerase-like protein
LLLLAATSLEGHTMKYTTIGIFVIAMSTPCLGQTKAENPALSSLVEAERSFAHTSLEIGARPAFMKFFADDAVVFRPGPVRYKEAMKDRPMPANPKETTLQWEPLYGDVAISGDLGYTTGPSVWTDESPLKRPPYYGFYFSVWKKQTTGEWKVAIDVGTEQPGPYTGSREFRAPVPVDRKDELSKLGPQEHVISLMGVEREFLEAVQKEGAVNAIARYQGKDARVYREKEIPIVGRDSLSTYFSAKPYLSQWNPMFCDVALSGELGYVYGGYEAAVPGAAQAQIENGFYLRVWKRDDSNAWKFVAEVLSALPPPPPPPKN